MIQKISTKDGQSWAIILNPINSLENLIRLRDDLIGLMITATQSEMFDTAKGEFCSVLSLLSDMSPTSEQIEKLEDFLSTGKA